VTIAGLADRGSWRGRLVTGCRVTPAAVVVRRSLRFGIGLAQRGPAVVSGLETFVRLRFA
jgi:hypothetical protein